MTTNTQRSTSRRPGGATPAAILLAASLAAYWEGYSPTGYADPVKIPTVCWGHTGPDVRIGMTVSLIQCREHLREDLLAAARAVERCVNRPLSDSQAAAFVSFTFNVGGSAFCKSTLVRLFNAGETTAACQQMGRWVFAKGVRLRGLERRRTAETSMCLHGTWSPPDGSVPPRPLGEASLVPYVVPTVGVNDRHPAVSFWSAERRFLPVQKLDAPRGLEKAAA